MQAITTIGLDIAKSVFQVHGVDADGQLVIRRKLKRRYVLAFFQKLPACLVGIEACATSHHWSRQLQALGHKVRLMPPAYVKPYVKRQKNDAAEDRFPLGLERAEVMFSVRVVGVTEVIIHGDCFDDPVERFPAKGGDPGGDDGAAADQMLPQVVIEGANPVGLSCCHGCSR